MKKTIPRQITVPLDIDRELEKENNASELISNLLISHYRMNKPNTEKIKDELNRLEQEEKQLFENKKILIQRKAEMIEKEKSREGMHTQRDRLIKREFAKATNRDITKEEIEEFIKLSDDPSVKPENAITIQEFAKMKMVAK